MAIKNALLQASSVLALATILSFGCNSGAPADSGNNAPANNEPTNTATTDTNKPATAARKAPDAPALVIEGNEIKIGLVASKNGDLKPWGEDSVNGAQLAMAEFEAAGGKIGDKSVKLIVKDSNSTPTDGKNAAIGLTNEGCVGIIGEVASGITAQLADVAFSKHLPIVAIGATRTDLSTIGSNFFRVCYTDDFQGPVMAKFAYEELGLRNVGIFTDLEQPYSVGLSKSFSDYFVKLGGKIAGEQNYKSKDTQFGSIISNIKGQNPDGLFLSGYFNEVGPIARQVKEAGLNVKMLGGDGWDSLDLLQSGGDAILGSYFCNHYNNAEPRPEVKSFLDAYKAKYNTAPATTMGALAYDATKLMLDAIKRANDAATAAGKPLDSAMIIDALENTEGFSGVSGSITLKGAGGNPQKRALVVEVVKPEGQKFAKAYEPSEVQ